MGKEPYTNGDNIGRGTVKVHSWSGSSSILTVIVASLKASLCVVTFLTCFSGSIPIQCLHGWQTPR